MFTSFLNHSSKLYLEGLEHAKDYKKETDNNLLVNILTEKA